MRKKYQVIEISILVFFLVRSSIILNVFGYLADIVKTDLILAIIFGTILGLIPILIYHSINNYKPNLNLPEKINTLFSKFISPLINVIILLSLAIISIYILNIISIYINYNILKDYPLMVIAIIFLAFEIYLVRKGLKTLIRSSNILISVVLIIFILSIIFLITSFNIDELRPLYVSGNMNLFKASLIYALSTSGPLFLLSIIKKDDIVIKKNYSKSIVITYLISSLIILITFIITNGILGINLLRYYSYSYLVILNKISFLGFIERVETIFSITYLFDGFILLNLIFQMIKELIEKTFQIKDQKSNNIIFYIISILIILGIYYSSHIPNKLYFYLSIIVSIIIPLIMLIKILLKKLSRR